MHHQQQAQPPHLQIAAWLVCCRHASSRDATAANRVMLPPPTLPLTGVAAADPPVRPAAASEARLARCRRPGVCSAARCTLGDRGNDSMCLRTSVCQQESHCDKKSSRAPLQAAAARLPPLPMLHQSTPALPFAHNPKLAQLGHVPVKVSDAVISISLPVTGSDILTSARRWPNWVKHRIVCNRQAGNNIKINHAARVKHTAPSPP